MTGVLNDTQRRHPISAVIEVQKVVKNVTKMIRICAWDLHIQLMKLPLKANASCATKCCQNSSVLPAKFRPHRDTNYPECNDNDFNSLRASLRQSLMVKVQSLIMRTLGGVNAFQTRMAF